MLFFFFFFPLLVYNESEFFFFFFPPHTVKWFQVLLCYSNNLTLNSSIHLLAMGKIIGQTELLKLNMVTSLGEGKR